MSPVSFCRRAAAWSATARISASTASKLLRPIVSRATISIRPAASAAFSAAALPPPGNGVARGGPGEIVRDGKVS